MTIHKKTLALTSLIILLPLFYGLAVWQDLPERIPTHFLLSGQANAWSSKATVVFLIPLFLLAIHWLGILLTSRDPRAQKLSPKIRLLIYALVPSLSIIILASIYGKALGYSLNIPLLIGLLFGLFLVIMGNYLPKIRQNHTVGIRLPWTLKNEVVWNKVHRLAGFIWVVGGLLMIIDSFLNLAFTVVFIGIIVAIVALPAIYAYYSYHHQG